MANGIEARGLAISQYLHDISPALHDGCRPIKMLMTFRSSGQVGNHEDLLGFRPRVLETQRRSHRFGALVNIFAYKYWATENGKKTPKVQ